MRRAHVGVWLSIAIWVALAACPLVIDAWAASQLAQYMTYGLFAMSLAFIWGQGGILCFGHALFFGVGAYAMALVTLGRLPALGDSQGVGVLLAVAAAAGVANLLGRLLFHGRGLSGAFFAIVTLCTAFIVEIAAQHWRFVGGFNGLIGVPPLAAPWRSGAGAWLGPVESFYAVFAIVLVVYLALLAIERSPFGTVFRTIRDNEYRTGFFGYDVTEYKTVAFTVSGAVAGLAGALFTAQFGFVSPALIGFALSTEVLIWTAVGGRGVPAGRVSRRPAGSFGRRRAVRKPGQLLAADPGTAVRGHRGGGAARTVRCGALAAVAAASDGATRSGQCSRAATVSRIGDRRDAGRGTSSLEISASRSHAPGGNG